MNPETIKAAQEALNPLADKLGQGAESLWEIYVRQVFAEGIFYLVASTFVIIMLATFWAVIARKWQLLVKYDVEDTVSIIAGFVSLFVLLFASAGLWQGVMQTVNPPYYAIERIITQVRGE